MTYFIDRPAVAKPAPYEEHVLLVHNVCLQQSDIDAVKEVMANPFFAICPLSNIFIHNALPPVERMRENDLDMVKELVCLHEAFPDVPMGEMIGWASLNGARFLKKEALMGSIAPGKVPGLVHITDVDEYGYVTSSSRSKRII